MMDTSFVPYVFVVLGVFAGGFWLGWLSRKWGLEAQDEPGEDDERTTDEHNAVARQLLEWDC